jgi:hypothetical protein
MADFQIRLQKNSISANDNIFMGYSRQGNYDIYPAHNDLSDHDAQLILIPDVDFHVQAYNIQNIRKINKYSLAEFN